MAVQICLRLGCMAWPCIAPGDGSLDMGHPEEGHDPSEGALFSDS